MSVRRIIQINRDRLRNGQPPVIVHRDSDGAINYHCQHLIESVERHVPCNCPRKVVATFECTKHGECTVLRKARDQSIPWCETCDDFTPSQSDV